MLRLSWLYVQLDTLTAHLLGLLAYTASHCSKAPVRREVCLWLSALLAALNSFEQASASAAAPALLSVQCRGEEVEYMFNHFHRVRHCMMQQALRSARSGPSGGADGLAPLPGNSSQKRSLELRGEQEAAKEGVSSCLVKCSPVITNSVILSSTVFSSFQ